MGGRELSFRAMTAADIEAGLRLCRAAGWNQLARDWELFLMLGAQGCRVAVKDDRVVGTVTTIRYKDQFEQIEQSDQFAWIGMVLVDPEERGRGIGTELLRGALEILSDLKSVRLDATPAGQPVYRKLGFVDEYGLVRMERRAGEGRLQAGQGEARPMTKADLPDVCGLDREVFGADRRTVLEWLFDGAPEYASIVSTEGRVAGYCFGRHGFRFEHLGPIVASDEQTACHLLSKSLREHADKPFIVDASLNDAGWRGWLESMGFREQRPFIRMFYGENSSPGRPQDQFAILGPEFG